MSATIRLRSSSTKPESDETPSLSFPDILSDGGFFREMANNALQGILVHRGGRAYYVNQTWAELHGMTVDEVMATPSILSLVHESDVERLKAFAEQRLAGGRPPCRYRYRALHKDGGAIWLEPFVRVLEWQGVKLIQSTVIDVDDQEREAVALDRLRQSMEREVEQRAEALIHSNRELHIHQSILDQMSERISVIGKDYRFRMSNRANLGFRQLTREQIVGLHVRETLGEAIFETDIKFKLDQAFSGQTIRSESAQTAADGTPRHVQVTLEPFRDPDGAISGAIASVRDITAAKEAEEQRHLFASMIEQISDRISVMDLNYRYKLANQATLDYYELPRSQIVGHHIRKIIGAELFETFTKPNLKRCFEGERSKVRHSFNDKHGVRQTMDALFEPYRNADGDIVGAVATIRDVTEAQNMSERLAYQARYDQLTGLLNRQAFERLLARSIAETAAGGRTDTLCFIDLDQFKIVNDTVGHLAGDRLLQQVANLFLNKLHQGDVLARFGGDEFVLLLRHCSLRRAKRAAERLIEALLDFKFFHEGMVFRIGASVGITAVSRHTTNAGDVLAQADLACYAAKDNGRNQVQIYKKCDVSIRHRQEEMYRAGEMRAALDNDRLVLFGQPILPVKRDGAGLAEHLEILLRMKRESGGLVQPSSFIPAAERYGFMDKVDRWVIAKTVSEMSKTDTSLAGASVNINLSGVTLNDETSLDFIRQTLSDTSLSPSRISFEITETAAVRNLAKTRAFIDELREWGCQFALDDFGSGLSSLKYLKRLPVDFLKIDGSFICDLARDQGSRAMVRAINRMAEDLGIQTVAEGVESLSILDTLRELGIDYVQGYAIGVPTALAS